MQHAVTNEVQARGVGGSGKEPSPTAGGCKTLQAHQQGPTDGGTHPGVQAPALPRVIDAEHLKLALVARKVRPCTRWAAMSNGAATKSCTRRYGVQGYYMHIEPVLAPMSTGRMATLLERVRAQGRGEVLRTWRAGIRVLEVEFASRVMRSPTPEAAA